MIHFARNLFLLREKKGLSQVKIAADIGFSRTTWSGYETNGSKPSFEDLLKIAEYFNINLHSLVFDDLSDTHLMEESGDTKYSTKNTPKRTPNSTPKAENQENNENIDVVGQDAEGKIIFIQAKYTNLLEKYNQVLEGKLIENEFRYKIADIDASVNALRELIIYENQQDLPLPSQKEAFFDKKKQDALQKSGILSGDSR